MEKNIGGIIEMNKLEKALEIYEKNMKMGEAIQAGFSDGVKGVVKPDNIKRFELLGAEKTMLYARKNADYGNSFDKSLDEDGLLVAKIRMMDKLLRFSQLIKHPVQVTEETLRETLIDLSNYADMTIMWMDAKEEAEAMERVKMLTTGGGGVVENYEPGIICGYNLKLDPDEADKMWRSAPADKGYIEPIPMFNDVIPLTPNQIREGIGKCIVVDKPVEKIHSED